MENSLVKNLIEEKSIRLKGRIYHKLQVDFTYNSNRIEGSKLTEEQTRYIFETNTIDAEGCIRVDDIIETCNHFICIDFVLDHIYDELTEEYIKKLHEILKRGTKDSTYEWFNVGDYKKKVNVVGNIKTVSPKKVPKEMKKLLENYSKKDKITIEDIVEFHYNFETIHPFQDGNGRVGRLIMLKECLKNNIVPFIITENIKINYYRGLLMWKEEKGYLIETCKFAQDKFKEYLDYFEIKYEE